MGKLGLFVILAAARYQPTSAQIDCSAQMRPLRPVAVGSSNIELFCRCDHSGSACRWEWGFASGTPSHSGIDASIPLQVQPMRSPVDSMIRAQEIRLQQQQLALQEEELKAL